MINYAVGAYDIQFILTYLCEHKSNLKLFVMTNALKAWHIISIAEGILLKQYLLDPKSASVIPKLSRENWENIDF